MPCSLLLPPQVCVQGIPWKYTWKELKELLAECGEVERADVMSAPDGRSKVRIPIQASKQQQRQLFQQTSQQQQQVLQHSSRRNYGVQVEARSGY
jgi:RNA recognition motif-containing protein